jgi:hypothetical protein
MCRAQMMAWCGYSRSEVQTCMPCIVRKDGAEIFTRSCKLVVFADIVNIIHVIMFNNVLHTDEMRLPKILPEYLPQYLPVMTAFQVYITNVAANAPAPLTIVAYTVTKRPNDLCLCGCGKVVDRYFISCLCCRGMLCCDLDKPRDFDICVMCTSTIFPQFMIQQCMLFHIFCIRCVSNCL